MDSRQNEIPASSYTPVGRPCYGIESTVFSAFYFRLRTNRSTRSKPF